MPMLRIAIAVLSTVLMISVSWAQQTNSPQSAKANSGTVGIISGGTSGTYIRIASDLASALNDGDQLRVLPIVGKGSLQNINDVLYLKGIDVGIVQSDVLEYLKRDPAYKGIENRIRYIAKLYNEEFHLVGNENIRTIQDLAGKRVNFGNKGSGTYITASTVFKALGVSVTPTAFSQAVALEKVRTGEVDALVYVAGKPARAFVDIKPEDGLRLVRVDYAGPLRKTYLPSVFSDDDYPGLVPPGKQINTVAVGAVMAVFNWKDDSLRYRKVSRFVNTFFSQFERLQKAPRHKKWQEINLSAELPGWVRFSAAKKWLAKNGPVTAADLVSSFKAFLEENNISEEGQTVSAAQKEALFKEFMTWQSNRTE